MIQQARGPTACARVHERWAHLRFSVIGQLLAAPPAKGELKAATPALAARAWQHPTTGDPVQFGFNVQAGTKRCCISRTKRSPKRGGQSAVKLDTLIPRPHLSTKPGQAQLDGAEATPPIKIWCSR